MNRSKIFFQSENPEDRLLDVIPNLQADNKTGMKRTQRGHYGGTKKAQNVGTGKLREEGAEEDALHSVVERKTSARTEGETG